MRVNQRKFKHYDTNKLTEVGFCPSVKNQVESFIQAGKVLEGAQNKLYHFTDDVIDDEYPASDPYSDKIEALEKLNELQQGLTEATIAKTQKDFNNFVKEKQKELKNSSESSINQ